MRTISNIELLMVTGAGSGEGEGGLVQYPSDAATPPRDLGISSSDVGAAVGGAVASILANPKSAPTAVLVAVGSLAGVAVANGGVSNNITANISQYGASNTALASSGVYS